MNGNLSSDQVRERSVAAMPSPLGEVHYWLHDEVAWLHLKWKAFRSLFATPPETIDLLNSTAPTFFSNLNRMMMEDVFLHLCRLTDPPRSAGKNTLTLRRLPTLIADPVLQLEVLVLTVVAERSTRFARDWRHRKLAHKELPPLDGQPPTPLASATYQDVEDALSVIRRTMNRIELHYMKLRVEYDLAIEGPGDVGALLAYLKRGVAAGRQRSQHCGGPG